MEREVGMWWEDTLFFFAVFGLLIFISMVMLSILVAGITIHDAIAQARYKRAQAQKTAVLHEAEAVAATAWAAQRDSG